MKIFIYKTLIVLISAYLLFELTVGNRIKQYENKIDSLSNKEERVKIIEKIKDEIKKANQKEKLFTDEEKELLSTFIYKIQNELSVDKPE